MMKASAAGAHMENIFGYIKDGKRDVLNLNQQ